MDYFATAKLLLFFDICKSLYKKYSLCSHKPVFIDLQIREKD